MVLGVLAIPKIFVFCHAPQHKVLPHTNFEEFGYRMHVASRLAYILGLFHRETPRKRIERLKLTKLGMHLPFECQCEEKIWVRLEELKKIGSRLSFQPTQTYKVVHGVFGCKHDMTPNFASGWACPSLSVMQNLNEFGHRTNIASRRACVLEFFHRKNLEKA